MFGKRYDARRVHNIDPFMRIIPYIMKTRTDSQNFFNDDILCEPLDAYLKQKKEEDPSLNYMTLIIAAMVRVIALRPQLNRFVMKNRVYARKRIWVSFVVHRSLRGDTAETTIKLAFDGTESLADVSRIVGAAVQENTEKNSQNNTDSLAKLIMSIPGPLIRLVVGTIMFMDRHEMLPRAIIEASPFHTSFFITNMKSLGINYIYHHVYEFGTTGIFFALGKEKQLPVHDRANGVVLKKHIPLGVVTDERYCDGLYFARSMRMLKKYLREPALLEQRLAHKVEDVD